MEVWTQWVRAKLTWRHSGVTYFARAPLRSYFHDPRKNDIYFLNEYESKSISVCLLLRKYLPAQRKLDW